MAGPDLETRDRTAGRSIDDRRAASTGSQQGGRAGPLAEAERIGSGPLDRLTMATSLGLLATLIGFVVGAETMTDNSLLTHLATGELILERRSVPLVDPYSRFAAGEPWTVQSWLVSLIYGLTGQVGGSSGVRALHGVVAAGIGLGLWQLAAPARRIVPRFGLAVMPLVLGVGLWSPRPLLFGLLALVAVLQVIRLDRSPWLLVPVMWLWVNAHGTFPLAFALIAAVALGQWLDRRQLPSRELRLAGFATVGTALAVINPVGLRLLTFPIRMLPRREALQAVVEWQPPTFASPWEWLYLGLIPLVVVAAKRGAGWQELLPAIGFLAMGLLAVRNIAPASIVVVAMVAPSLRDLFGRDEGTAASPISRAVGSAALVALAVGGAAVLIGPGLDLTLYPEREVDYLEEQALFPSPDVVVVHREAVGNYLTFRYGAGAGVFMDDRFDFHPLDLSRDHLTLLEGGDYDDVLDRRGADVVLWEADGLLTDWLRRSDRWQFAMDGDRWVVACRVDSPAFGRCSS